MSSLYSHADRRASTDLKCSGEALVVTSIVSFALALSWADNPYQWQSTAVVLPLTLGTVGFGIWVLHEWNRERRGKEAILPLAVFRSSTATIGVIAEFLGTLISIVCQMYVVRSQTRLPITDADFFCSRFTFKAPGSCHRSSENNTLLYVKPR